MNNANQELNLFLNFRKALKGLHLNNRGCNPRFTMKVNAQPRRG